MHSADEDVLEKLIRAGSIAREAREFGISHVAAGGSSLELADAMERLIMDRGAKCAFPVNIGVNDVAAHYTPSKDNDLRFRLGDIVKLDVGAHVDGYPGDTSATVEVGTKNHTKLIEAANEALKMCIEMASPGLGSHPWVRPWQERSDRPVSNLSRISRVTAWRGGTSMQA